tara:strand:- start:2877 stop:5045 length:2169 start_codon:yes stop_codon:yes gene_type:complete
LKPTDLSDLAAGRHRDPFAVLGPHRNGDKTLIRTIQPQASSVAIVDQMGNTLTNMRRVNAEGIYSASISTDNNDYRLRVTTTSGHSYDFDDPYRFESALGQIDLHLLGQGEHHELYEKLGAHRISLQGVTGTHFAVWAPNAGRVSVVGEFNDWDGRRHSMRLHPDIGVWDIFIPGVDQYALYKFEILDASWKLLPLKSDPLAHFYEGPPGNASRVYDTGFEWSDQAWMSQRSGEPDFSQAMSVYEVHLGSWRRNPWEGNRFLGYRELAEQLVGYVTDMGFTHIELLPITEHPFDGSWGYQPIGMCAPTYRFGEPDDFRYFIDVCHKAGIGVIIDWVPAHFPRDSHGLGRFDGTALYEHADPRRGEHSDWGTLIFNYGRNEVRNYLLASALFWIKEFHVDALRVDAVASMLYLDYSREDGEWLPNEHGGNENLEAVSFLQRLNEVVHAHGAMTFAEESTSWPRVSGPTYDGGLGFTYKWNMGWMNDTLSYMSEEPVHRKYHHNKMTFGMAYAYTENFLLPLSHDEVVHGKRSLLGRMPGDDWQKFANLRVYFGFMYSHPGKKLLFMGGEFGQGREWNHDDALDWHLLDDPLHRGMQDYVRDLNSFYRNCPAMHQQDVNHEGFQWLIADDNDSSVFAWLRRAANGDAVLCVSNFTPVVRHHYRIGVPDTPRYRESINSDDQRYGGSGVANPEVIHSEPVASHGQPASVQLTIPPLATIILQPAE